jgi:hypothetical protein
MANEVTQAALDQRAQAIADLLDELPWCECIGYLVAEEEDEVETDEDLNQYLQAFDVLVFDGYVTDFMRLARSLADSLKPRFDRHELVAQVTLDYQNNEDPNLAPLSLMVHYHGPDEGYLSAREALLNSFESIVARSVEEWTQDEDEDEEPIETLV